MPGPDGLPATAWRAHRYGIDVLTAGREWITSGSLMPDGFSDGACVYPPKKVLDSEGAEVVRDPTDTRPLMLKNTGAKAIASAANRCLSVAAAK
eukprot:3829522-Pyramimonas_sp.AAC.1